MISPVDDISRNLKRQLVLLFDLACVVAALTAAICLRMSDIWPAEILLESLPLYIVIVILGAIVLMALRIPSLRLSAIDPTAVSKNGLAALVIAVAATMLNIMLDLGAPRTTPLIFGPIMFALSVGGKVTVLALLQMWGAYGNKRVPVAIYGAGEQGLQLLSALRQSRDFQPVAIVDDNPIMHGVIMGGLAVEPPSTLRRLAAVGGIRRVLLALPNESAARRARQAEALHDIGCEIQMVPTYADLIDKGGMVQALTPISAEDLLGRGTVDVSLPGIEKVYAGQSVMITGAGGSIGAELCRQILELRPRAVVLFEQNEYALYQIEQELRTLIGDAPIALVPALGSVCDKARLVSVLRSNDVGIVLHAAAHKHVPLIEDNEIEGLRNNVFGTLTAGEAAVEAGTPRFVLISTDKAVRPTSVMGASKRLAEIVIGDIQRRAPITRFAVVRFGNVLNSSGSVIPLFREQIAAGGPVTVTHPSVTRYFMTLHEAARLVLLAGSYAGGGDTFVLDMGKPVKIAELARQMIELSGLSVRDAENPDGEIAIDYIGLRPGEKLFEELLIGEGMLPTPHPKILRADEELLPESQVRTVIKALQGAIETQSRAAARDVIERWVEGYEAPRHGQDVAAE